MHEHHLLGEHIQRWHRNTFCMYPTYGLCPGLVISPICHTFQLYLQYAILSSDFFGSFVIPFVYFLQIMYVKTGINMIKPYRKHINNIANLPKIRRYLFILLSFKFGGHKLIHLTTSDTRCICI
jgi:hypothetical protein